MLDRDRRTGDLQSRREKERNLSDEQVIGLRNFEQIGWELLFVRQSQAAEPVPVMYDVDTGRYAVLEKDGVLNKEHDLTIRRE